MIGKILFAVALLLFVSSLFLGTVTVGGERVLNGLETFLYTLRYGTAGVLSARSLPDFVVHLVSLVAAAANFIFVFWAMLVNLPCKVTSLRGFWWISLMFLLAAVYTGGQAYLSDRVSLLHGYYTWIASLVCMLAAPVVCRYQSRLRKSRVSKMPGGVQQMSCG